MTIVKREKIELSANERKAFDMVDKMLENVTVNAEDPDVQDYAQTALGYLRSFRHYTEEII